MAEPTPTYDAGEQDILLDVFRGMLSAVTKDGGNKRARGEKPPWWRDPAHEAAIFSHLSKWKHGELRDTDSGVHPLVHLAWRALAIAHQETYGKRDPASYSEFDLTELEYISPARCCANWAEPDYFRHYDDCPSRRAYFADKTAWVDPGAHH